MKRRREVGGGEREKRGDREGASKAGRKGKETNAPRMLSFL